MVLLKKVNKKPKVTWLFTIPYSFPEKVAHPAQRIHCLCGSAMQLKNGENSKQKRALLVYIKYKFLKGAPLPPKLQASAQRLKSRCCLLLFAGSKIPLSPLLPVSILVDSLLPSRKRLVRPLLCCILWSSASVCVFRIAGIRRRFPIYLNVSSRFWAAHLVSSAITAGSPCGSSAAYSPFAYLTLPKHIFFFSYFTTHRSASCR